MIKLTKRDKPDILVRLAATWTAELLKKISAGEKPTEYLLSRYREKGIKDALIAETHAKCAYCESKLLHVTFGDVEHVIPKSVDRSLSFEWTNLTLACDRCNTNKAAYPGDHGRIIDPYSTDPLAHMNIFGPLIFGKPGDSDGKITEKEIELNRGPLIEQRSERLQRLNDLIATMLTNPDSAVRDTIRRDIEKNELADEAEYAAFAREFYTIMKSKS